MASLITSIRGLQEEKGNDWADVSLGGITFRISVPASSVEDLGSAGSQVRIFTSLQVREDSLNLYGFISREACQTFETLIGVNGVGPRVALSILSDFSPASLASAIESSDVIAFTRVPGIGKKTAARIVLELKGKLEETLAIIGDSLSDDALDALVALGYSASESRDALSQLSFSDEESVEEKIRMALASLTE